MQLPEQASIEQVPALAEALPAEVAAGSGVFSVDASALKAYDTSTISLLLQARRLATSAGRAFEVTGAPRQLAQLASLYGVEELLELSSDKPRTGSA